MNNIQDKYRHIFFGSPVGREVLGDLLSMCHLGCPLDHDNKAVIGQHNLGMLILNKCGVFGNGTEQQLINSFAAIVPEQEKEDE